MAFSNTQKDGNGVDQWLVSDPTYGNLQIANGALQAVTALASTQRTTTTNSDDLTNPGARGALVTLDVSAVAGSSALTLSVQAKDPTSSNYITLLSATTGATTTGVKAFLVYPGAGAAGASVNQVAGFPVPETWRVSVAHASTEGKTYSVGVNYLP